ncbi:alpha-L-rhamnosidase C-terminal domain-containing protein [Dysgonomonas sp. ZJ709]|uniref:alpha-L-rhamnosidase-related protein n=1 Tax=Dysgonomonas sp. ZJ709 TaxID=2709797 RepID=UPI0013ED99EB|nr:alpha-L-rhamnosidase C-terminal domain-containing protein [Dysgonomonas sp. ZJ709]
MKIRTSIRITFVLLLLFSSANIYSQKLPPIFTNSQSDRAQPSSLTRSYISPTRIVWMKSDGGASIQNEDLLLREGNGQADLSNNPTCILKSDSTDHPAIVLDFGKEIHGGMQFITGRTSTGKPIKMRVRLGESVSEVMSNIGEKEATNDHAIRDQIIDVPLLGNIEIGNSGFRFVRIDLVENKAELQLKEARAILVYQDIPYLGSFNSSDDLLNNIWLTGAYTVHLNMQDYLWDGIKRDRLVWAGDMHPEVSTINAVFGYNDVVPKSLDLNRDLTPLPNWINGISSYSMWWVIMHKDWYMHHADLKYLKEQREYLIPLLKQLCSMIDENGSEKLNGWRFMDWPSSENQEAIHGGLQALMVWSLSAGKDMCLILNEKETAKECEEAINKLKKHIPETNNSKQAAALLSIVDLITPTQGNSVVTNNGVHDFSTFYGYYMLQAMAKADNYDEAIDYIRQYWGGMLSIGATTFWEDFNIDWLENASPIDAPVQAGKKDIHGDYGNYCYVGLRHSLCHGWASGPTAWLTEHVLGIQVIEAGCKTIRIEPHLGNLEFAEGSFPTPYGLVKVKHTKDANGKITSKIDAPKGVKIIK